MMALRLAGVVLVAILLAPAAHAEAAQGRFDVAAPAHLEGVSINADTSALTLEGLPTLRLEAASVSIERHVRTTTRLALVDVTAYESPSAVSITEHSAATVELANARADPQFGLTLVGPARATLADAEVAPATGAKIFAPASQTSIQCTPGTCLDIYGAYAATGPRLFLEGTGTVVLMLYGGDLLVKDASGTTTYASGVTPRGASGARTEDAIIILRAAAASLDIEASDARFFAVEPTLEANAVLLPAAEGAMDVGLRTYRAVRSDMAATGALTLVPGLVAPADDYGDGIRYADGFTTELHGDVQTINLAAIAIYAEPEAQAAGFAAILAFLAAGLAYFWPHLSFHATALIAPLYTRLKPPQVLANDVRHAIFEIIRTNPGISARAVHRESGQSWGTVVYHLRQLESHHLVVSRRFGRARNYYENHGKYRGMEAQLACLRSARARALAAVVLAQPGVTQEGLSLATGLAQPTTSYYARKLAHAELVTEARDGRYVKYGPTPDLDRFLRLAERVDEAPPSGPSPANA